MPYSKHNETNIVAPKKNFNVNEHLKYLSIRRNEEWKYYSKKMFRVVRNTFICHCFQSNTNVAALNTASPSSKHSFHTAIGKYNCQISKAHLKGISVIKWFVNVNKCNGHLAIGVVRNTQQLLLNAAQDNHFDFTETEQGKRDFGSGDMVTVLLNLTNGHLAFAVNNSKDEVAFGKDERQGVPVDQQYSYRLAMAVGFGFYAKVTLAGITFW
ncbi:hypothetical protein RFI_24295 [Reticulomyxa filosa]|uniref:B30.2/SPRY domain-containing protein n=1 Tax=Reticulomyxa filosa TaxID=46433 RepID=X6MGD3_RETFI|nr:hypothetical protein RFI_24295 [Reticulomyxa filosa]|eukprot:ETO13083.1 hypothetical protein RFI_24295 [Reticulomyxa filosa]